MIFSGIIFGISVTIVSLRIISVLSGFSVVFNSERVYQLILLEGNFHRQGGV